MKPITPINDAADAFSRAWAMYDHANLWERNERAWGAATSVACQNARNAALTAADSFILYGKMMNGEIRWTAHLNANCVKAVAAFDAARAAALDAKIAGDFAASL